MRTSADALNANACNSAEAKKQMQENNCKIPWVLPRGFAFNPAEKTRGIMCRGLFSCSTFKLLTCRLQKGVVWFT
jgi:hypothetical protein